MKFNCAHCGKIADRPTGHVRRSRAQGMNLYCGRKCSNLGRRDGRTKAQKVEAKRLYDIQYRKKNYEKLKDSHRAYHLRTYDPEKARIVRKKNMARHVEYCRQPEYKRWKKTYDRRYRAKKFYGPMADAFLTVLDLTKEIKSRSTSYEIRRENQTFGKRQARSREAGDSRSYGHRTA